MEWVAMLSDCAVFVDAWASVEHAPAHPLPVEGESPGEFSGGLLVDEYL